MRIYTIGHSTRSIEEFLDALREHGVRLVADVRSVPKSRHNPQYDTDAMRKWLPAAGIAYEHLPALGGFRHPRAESPNTGWRKEAFRGYADYMQTPEFERALEELISLAGRQATAIMCAEAVPWRCHRSLIGDALLARGIEVIDIFGPGSARPHRLTPFAKVEGTRVTYPAPADSPVR